MCCNSKVLTFNNFRFLLNVLHEVFTSMCIGARRLKGNFHWPRKKIGAIKYTVKSKFCGKICSYAWNWGRGASPFFCPSPRGAGGQKMPFRFTKQAFFLISSLIQQVTAMQWRMKNIWIQKETLERNGYDLNMVKQVPFRIGSSQAGIICGHNIWDLLRHIIVSKIVLDNCRKFYLEHNCENFTFILFHQTYFQSKIRIFLFFLLRLTFCWGFHTCMLTINRAGSVSKTSDTWRKYRYLRPTSQVSTVSLLGMGIVPNPICPPPALLSFQGSWIFVQEMIWS